MSFIGLLTAIMLFTITAFMRVLVKSAIHLFRKCTQHTNSSSFQSSHYIQAV